MKIKYNALPFQCLFFILLVHLTYLPPAQSLKIPRLSPIGETTLNDHAAMAASDAEDFETFYYNQTLDYFNYRPESYPTFQQRYLINFKYWGGANSSAPIFAYFGAEAPIDLIFGIIGFPIDNAASFNALIVYIKVINILVHVKVWWYLLSKFLLSIFSSSA